VSSSTTYPSELPAIRTLIVDDSSMTRWLLQQILETDSQIEVIGSAADANEAREMIKRLSPDVITLDIEMPGMNGIRFLKNLMRLHPLPVVMVSSLTKRGAQVTLDALSLGAVDFVAKPESIVTKSAMAEYSAELIAKVKIAKTARLGPLKQIRRSQAYMRARTPGSSRATAATAATADVSRNLVAIGASTGGTEAVAQVLSGMPEDGPGILVVQHISDGFNEPFVKRLNDILPLDVRTAKQGEIIRCGSVYVAPPGHHLRVEAADHGYRCVLTEEDPINFHRPAVDAMFESIARHAMDNATGVILTGMGKDGARGLLAMREAGSQTVVQDEASSVVWGMPGAAAKLGAAETIAPLGEIADLISTQPSS